MTRYLPFAVLVAALASIAAKAQMLGTLISPDTSSTQALASLKSFTKTARRVKYADNGSIQLKNASTLTRKVH